LSLPVPKFNIGQTIFYANVSWTSKDVQCPDCLGTKKWKVTLPSGEEFQHPCNTCRRGYYETGTIQEWGDFLEIKERTIGSIQIDTNSKDEPIRYMCVETGVGSGSIYPEVCLFAIKEEAEAWGKKELERVKYERRIDEMERRHHKKHESLIHGERKKKEKKT
jgi:hypothetical protein